MDNDRVLQIQEKWRKEYDKSVPEKIALIEGLIQKMKGPIVEEDLNALRIEIHKMAGSAGTVGYLSVSAICKQFEQEILLKHQSLKDSNLDIDWRDIFSNYLEKIRAGFSSFS